MPSKPRAEYDIRAKDESAAGWRSALSTAHSNASKLKSTLGTAFGGVLSIQLFTSQISKAIEFGDEIGKLSVRMGANVEVTQELVAIARRYDIEMSGLATSFKKMQVGVSQASTGNKELLETFAALGLNIKEISRLQPDEQFIVIGDAISRMKKPADQARAELALLGRTGNELRPMFENGAEGMRKARDEVRQFGQILSEMEIKKLQDADDAIKTLSATWDTFWRKVAVGTVQYGEMIGGAAEKLKQFATQQGGVADFFRRTLSGIPGIGMPLAMITQAQADADARQRRLLAVSRGGGQLPGTAPAPPPGYGGTGPGAFTPDDFAKLMEGSALRRSIADMQEWRDLVDHTDKVISDGMIETNKDLEKSFDDLQEPILSAKDTLTVFGEEAARNAQDAFAQYLFDPFQDGLRGMLKGFVDILRQMAAQAAAAKIFDKIGGIEGIGDWISKFFLGAGKSKSATPGSSSGGWSGPRYAMGTDFVPRDQLAFVHRGEKIIPAGRNRGMGAPNINIPIHIDARGATSDFIKAMPEILNRAKAAWKSEVVRELKAGRYG